MCNKKIKSKREYFGQVSDIGIDDIYDDYECHNFDCECEQCLINRGVF